MGNDCCNYKITYNKNNTHNTYISFVSYLYKKYKKPVYKYHLHSLIRLQNKLKENIPIIIPHSTPNIIINTTCTITSDIESDSDDINNDFIII